jgi:hypothetical protein
MRRLSIIVSAILFLAVGCKKDNETTVTSQPQKYFLKIDFRYNVDNSPLVFNSLNYTNDASNNYSVTSLRYYLSRISLVTDSDTHVYLQDYIFIDASASPVLQFDLADIPKGRYKGISFNVGLDSAQNITGHLPVNSDNLAMEWPVLMGGGYHFMMLEGHFSDTSGTPGYAMHLGTNASLCPVNIVDTISVYAGGANIHLHMNINEWFRTPSVYDFNVDGNYIMGNVQAMSKIAANGFDAFSIGQQ